MTNDVIQLNAIVSDISHNLAELAALEQNGDLSTPPTITPANFVEMIGQPVGSWQPQSKDVIWFTAFKLTAYARHMLAQSARIFQQMDDEALARQVESVIGALDEQFHPAETAFRVYSKLLNSELDN